jgi:hypothetical protein
MISLAGCSLNQDQPARSFKETAVLTSPAKQGAFRLDTLFNNPDGKDPYTVRSAFAESDSTWFRIRSPYLGNSPLDTVLPLPGFIDSSGDGGKTWVPWFQLPRKAYLSSAEIFTGKNVVYVNWFGALFCIDRKSKAIIAEREVDSKFIRYDQQRNVLIILTYNYLYKRIRDTSELLNKDLSLLHPTIKLDNFSIAYARDSLYFLFQSYETSKANVPLYIIDTLGRHRQIDLPVTMEDNYRYQKGIPLFVGPNSINFIGNNRSKSSYERDSLYTSVDYGRSWNKSRIKMPAFESIRQFEPGALLASQSLYSSKGFFSIDYFNTYCAINDSLFKSHYPSIKDNFSNRLLVSLNDTSGKDVTLVTLVPVSVDSLPKLKTYSISEAPKEITIRVMLDRSPLSYSNTYLQLYGAHAFNLKQEYNLINISWDNPFKPLNAEKTIWECSFPISSINAVAGQGYSLVVDYYDNTFHQQYDMGEKIFTPVPFAERYPGWYNVLRLAALISIILLILLVIYWVAPYWLFSMYTLTPIFRTLAGKIKFGEVFFELLNFFTLLPLFANSNRVTDAWVRRNTKLGTYFNDNEETARKHRAGDYLPVGLKVITNTGSEQEIEQPDPKEVAFILKQKRVCIQVTGGGGMGKTTFALQLARWLMEPAYSENWGRHLWLPLLIEEEVTDLVSVIEAKVTRITGKKIDPAFLKILLKRKRLLVIVDALSERSIPMQEHIKGIYGQHAINALLITSRVRFDMDIPENIECRPRSMDGVKIYAYVKNALQKSNLPVFASEIEKAEVFKKMLSLFNSTHSVEGQVYVTPVLVQLLAARIILFARQQGENATIDQVLQNMPSSVPEIFTDYIKAVNPATGANLFSGEEILLYTEMIAECSVGDNYIPSDADLFKTVMPAINALNTGNKGNVIQRLTANGVLKTVTYAGTSFVRFELDPVAEYLAAIHKAKKCGNEVAAWAKLYGDIHTKKAFAFLAIMDLVHDTYKQAFRWPEKPFHTPSAS